MPLPRNRITYEDYLQLPEDSRYEVLEGDLRMVPAPNVAHQTVLFRLTKAVSAHVEQRDLGIVLFAPLDVILDEDTVVQPDLLVVLADHLTIIKPEGVRGAPDLVAEVLSPGTATRDRGVKRRLYGKYGVREYWLVDPQGRTVEVCSLRDGLLETCQTYAEVEKAPSLVLPGLEVPVGVLFAPRA